MKDIRVIVTVKNAVMLRAMEQAGFNTANELARASAVSNSIVGQYLNLKLAPYNASGELRESIIRIAHALKRLPEDLFPAPFLRRALQTNRVTRDVDAASLPALMATAPPSIAYDPERSFVVKEAVDSLMNALDSMKTMDGKSDARGIAVVKHYYGLEGGEPSTLDATAKHFGVTRERVRQILLRVEWRLKRKLNSPQYEDAKSAMLEMM